jgi:cell division FtsZ-interacting protein ZapD
MLQNQQLVQLIFFGTVKRILTFFAVSTVRWEYCKALERQLQNNYQIHAVKVILTA